MDWEDYRRCPICNQIARPNRKCYGCKGTGWIDKDGKPVIDMEEDKIKSFNDEVRRRQKQGRL